ncbi:MAG: hypothetical protein LQ349_009756 [Xanthoria aureola]|nr:MAG: hypothetical protein LQ349_009756 [Xanthoria aureola]
MHGPFIPSRSGVHKAACFALFRALLRRGRNTLAPEPSNQFQQHVNEAFRTNAKIQNQRAIRVALTAGYGVLDDLATRKLQVLKQLAEAAAPKKVTQLQSDRRRASDGPSEQESSHPKSQLIDNGRRSPHPAARPMLDGLPPPLPGYRRRVPTMINANHIPFLRFKKPQSPFLSHMIRKKTEEREKRITRTQRLEKLLPLAEDEDRWDDIVKEIHGISSNDRGTSWAWATEEALMHVRSVHKNNTMRRMHIAHRMFDIMDGEKKLAEREKLERRDRRHQAYKARRKSLKEATLAAEQPSGDPIVSATAT